MSIKPLPYRDFAREMVAIGQSRPCDQSGEDRRFYMTIDGHRVTPENFERFSNKQLKRGIWHGIAPKEQAAAAS